MNFIAIYLELLKITTQIKWNYLKQQYLFRLILNKQIKLKIKSNLFLQIIVNLSAIKS